MKLKEKFKQINCKDCDMPYCDVKCTTLSENELEILKTIAEEFAIGFALWKQNYVTLSSVDVFYYLKNSNGISFGNPVSIEELLEIYKKEKGL